MGRVFLNPGLCAGLRSVATREPIAFHARLPGYRPTPLRKLPEQAAQLGISQLLVKDESARLGLPAFKMLGASWAAYCAVAERLGLTLSDWSTIQDLRANAQALGPVELITATDGNHGRAVARVAATLGFAARIFIPSGTAEARIQGIQSEGAAVVIVEGTYDDAVASAAAARHARSLMVQDTSYPGYEDIPQRVIEGYATLFWEIDDELARTGEPPPDVVMVQVGVGALAAAAVKHFRRAGGTQQPAIVSVEPTSAACAFQAAERGEVVTVPGPHDSIMAGLNCGMLSTVAWPLIRDGVDAFVTIDDDRAGQAVRLLAGCDIRSGESGSAGLGGLLELLDERHRTAKAQLSLSHAARVLVIATEGATDPVSYRRIVA